MNQTTPTHCPPWCVNHDGTVCHAPDITAGRNPWDSPDAVGLTHDPADGTRIHVGGRALTPREALAVANAILSQVATAHLGKTAVAA